MSRWAGGGRVDFGVFSVAFWGLCSRVLWHVGDIVVIHRRGSPRVSRLD